MIELSFPVTVYYNIMSLSEMISAGDYERVHPDINTDHFLIKEGDCCKTRIVLFHFNRVISSDDVIKEIEKAEYRPANLAELLALGMAQPKLLKHLPIVALGQHWFSPGGIRYAVALGRDGVRHILYLQWLTHRCHSRWRFAAVCKS